ncbi:acetyl-CoA carboxylase biotin carboxylase subunit [Dactylosporangium sp. NPDC050688]|uniref:acetyl-CoA carboxylase biotin carboxylase subunit n=1 Tax=Dactylosporangium sp. NPDC050688 TaxID=3157217 RepID=UPI0033EF3397
MFDKVLIANRGEIALRVARACRELGVATVAVYSTEDRDSPVVRYADEAVHIGPGAARASYRNIAAVVEAARQTGAQAIHPGYGFLSEDADFAEVCAQNDIVFIGPPAHVIAQLGDKCAARRVMSEVGLPVLPGSHGPVVSAEEATALLAEIGYPAIFKAAAGGGGRGMAVVTEPREVVTAYQGVTSESLAVFGDGRIYVERYVAAARHIEVQVLCDGHGNGVHLGLRDCSVQRRHQKLLEESPAPGLSAQTADRMGQAAVAAALAVGYVGAGTFEFLVDEDERFYFMEANCRIQVEHPVTEAVTGVDLVQQQLRVAAGERLALRQADVVPRGAAIECRINVENPDRDFAPAPGVFDEFVVPGGPFVRVDTHGYPGYRMPAIYDSLIAKIIVWAPDRAAAIARMDRALAEFRATGRAIHTTAGFLRQVLAEHTFRDGTHTTTLVGHILHDLAGRPAGPAATRPEEGAPRWARKHPVPHS